MGDPQPEYQESTQQKPWYKRIFTLGHAENAGEAIHGTGGFAVDLAGLIGGFVGSMEKGNNIAGAVASCVDVLKGIYELTKQIIVSIKKKDGSSGNILSIVKHSLDELMVMGKAASDLGKLFSTVSHIPIVGAVCGAISTSLSLIGNLKQLVYGSMDHYRMSEQRQAAARAIAQKQENATNNASSTTTPANATASSTPASGTTNAAANAASSNAAALSLFQLQRHRATRDDMTVNAGMVTDAKTGKQRKKRLDEVLKDGAITGDLREDAEKLAVSQTLAETNKHRVKNAIYDIVMDDLVGFGKTIIALIPAIGGDATAAGISVAQASVSAGRKGIRWLRQKGRDHGWKGFDANKSTYNKKVQRHRLAVMLYNRIKGLNQYHIEQAASTQTPHTEEQLTGYRKALTAYPETERQVSALQVGYYHLQKTQSADEMVALMRQGFYAKN